MSSLRDLLFGGTPGSKRFPELRPPNLLVDEPTQQAFDRFTAITVDPGVGEASYDLPYPKHEYLRWLSRERPVLFHGSPAPRRNQLHPRRAKGLDREGRRRGVYASPWPLFAMWFAVLNRRWPFIWTTNGSRAVDDADQWERVYWFKVNRRARRPSLLADGTLYVFRRDGFTPVSGTTKNDEHPGQWISREPVVPLFALPVRPDDFPFASEVTSR